MSVMSRTKGYWDGDRNNFNAPNGESLMAAITYQHALFDLILL